MAEMFDHGSVMTAKRVPVSGSAIEDAATLSWQASGVDGFWIKVLMEDAAKQIRTWLMKIDPGAASASHSHDDIEQIYVLEGTFYDQEGSYEAGNYLVRAAGTEHIAGSIEGCIVLLTYSPAR